MKEVDLYQYPLRAWQIALCKSTFPLRWRRASIFWFRPLLPDELSIKINSMIPMDDCAQPSQAQIAKMLGYGQSKQKDQLLNQLSDCKARHAPHNFDWQSYLATWKDDFEIALHYVALNGHNLQYMSDSFRDNELLVHAALSNSNCIHLVSSRLRQDREFLYHVYSNPLCHYGETLRHLSPTLQDDENFVLLLLNNQWNRSPWGIARNFPFVSYRLCAQPNIIRTAIESSEDSSVMEYASDDLKRDRAFIHSLVFQYPQIVLYIPNLHITETINDDNNDDDNDDQNNDDQNDDQNNDNKLVRLALQREGILLRQLPLQLMLRNCKWAVLAAISSWDEALCHASSQLQNDKEVVDAAIKNCPQALQWAGDQWRDNEETVRFCVCRDGDALKYASDRLRDHHEIILEATTQEPRAVRFILNTDTYCCDPTFMFPLIQRQPLAHKWMGNSLKGDTVFLHQLWKTHLISTTELYRVANISVETDVKFAIQLLGQNGLALQYMPDMMKNNSEVVRAACRKASSAFRYASYRLRNNFEMVHSLCQENAYVLRYATKQVRNNDQFLNEYFRKNFAKRIKS